MIRSLVLLVSFDSGYTGVESDGRATFTTARAGCRCRWRHGPAADGDARRVKNVHRSLEGSFSAGSTATIATKYSFFQVFRDLQNYLAQFSKILQNFAKSQRFSQKSELLFAKIRKFRKNFAKFKIFRFLQKFATF